jgi:hypothetical protein
VARLWDEDDEEIEEDYTEECKIFPTNMQIHQLDTLKSITFIDLGFASFHKVLVRPISLKLSYFLICSGLLSTSMLV